MMKADQEMDDLQQQIKALALTEGQYRYLPRAEYHQQLAPARNGP
jgi:hypothetical protein